MMSDLELVATDELVKELKRRTPAGMCFYAMSSEDGDRFCGRSWGSLFWRAGVATAVGRELRAMAEAMIRGDTEEDEDE